MPTYKRPAETTTVALGAAGLIAYALGVKDREFVVSLAAVLTGTPAVVTALVHWLQLRKRRTE